MPLRFKGNPEVHTVPAHQLDAKARAAVQEQNARLGDLAGASATYVRRLESDDPAFSKDRELHVVRTENGQEMYADRDDLEDLDEALKEHEERPRVVRDHPPTARR